MTSTINGIPLDEVASDGVQSDTIDVDEGKLKLGNVAVTATAAELNNVGTADRVEKTVVVALAASDAAAGLFSWQNTEESADIIVTRLVLNVTTATTGACTGDFGSAATAILDDTLIDGQDLNAAVGVFDSIAEAGTNGAGSVLVADDEFVTGSVASGASAGIVGNAYISYVVV